MIEKCELALEKANEFISLYSSLVPDDYFTI
jgi:hypothetical protein